MKSFIVSSICTLIFLSAYSQKDTMYLHAASREKDPKIAIVLYTKAIPYCEANSQELRQCYLGRGWNKLYVSDYYGCISDIEKGLAIKTTKTKSYFQVDLEFIQEEEEKVSYYHMGLAYIGLGDKKNGCLCFSKLGEMGDPEAYDLIAKHCN